MMNPQMSPMAQNLSGRDRICLYRRHLRHQWLLSLLLGGCAAEPSPQRYEFTRIEMGVQARIVIYGTDGDAGRDAASDGAAAAFADIARLDAIMSDYRPESELMQLSAAAGAPAAAVSDDLFAILSGAQQIAHASGGAFDVTVGPLSMLWREARRQNRMPDPAAIEAARARVGWRWMTLNDATHTVQLKTQGMSLDLGGIAKGYAANRARDRLRELGFARCLVALAGDIAVGRPPPGKEGWEIALTSPAERSSPPRILLLADSCVSTSGGVEQFLEIDGVRYSHIIDPRTGLGVTNSIVVTVVAPRGEVADALASACNVLGWDAAQNFARRFPDAAFILEAPLDHGRMRTIIDRGEILRWRQQ